jgi:hypothetical protein
MMVILLVVPETDYSKYVSVVIGTNILRSINTIEPLSGNEIHLILFTYKIDSVAFPTILSNNDGLLTVYWLNLPIVML